MGAAAEAFGAVGFERATLGDIVARAGTSIGNLYKYFANKEELFAAALPRSLPAELRRLVRAQVEALRLEPKAFALGASHPYRQASEALLRFTLDHRWQVVFLLQRAEGTEHARFAGELVRLLVGLALRHARDTYPRFAVTPAKKRALARIYQAFVTTLAALLEHERSERALREAVALHTLYHLSGLEAFFLAAAPRTPRRGTAR